MIDLAANDGNRWLEEPAAVVSPPYVGGA